MTNELREALEPFARVVKEWDGEPAELEVELRAYDDKPGPSVSVIDFRNARQALASLSAQGEEAFDLLVYLRRQRTFSEKTFGPGARAKGIIDHICKELIEVEQAPSDLKEWIDVVTLALDGAWRAGYPPEQIAAQLDATLTRNEGRKWPDWRTMPTDQAIEHDRSADGALSAQGEEVERLKAEVDRLNKWADEFSDAQLKERRLCEARIQEIQQTASSRITDLVKALEEARKYVPTALIVTCGEIDHALTAAKKEI